MKPLYDAANAADLAAAAKTQPRAFTLVELLVAVTVIALLIGIAIPAFRKVANDAMRTRELAGARQVLTAWTTYSVDAKGAIMPGFKTGLPAFQQNGDPIPPGTYGGGPTVAARYPWRLAPYLGHNFRVLFTNQHEDDLVKLEEGDYGQYLYFTSLYPGLGLNSTWVGGDSERYGFLPGPPSAPPNPFTNMYVSRQSSIRHPDRLLVFGSSRTDGTVGGGITEGYFRLDSPAIVSTQWSTQYDPLVPASFGNLSARYGRDAICAFAGGNVESKSVDDLRDMRYWADQADKPDWKLTLTP